MYQDSKYLAPKYLHGDHFTAKVYTTWVHGPLGAAVLGFGVSGFGALGLGFRVCRVVCSFVLMRYYGLCIQYKAVLHTGSETPSVGEFVSRRLALQSNSSAFSVGCGSHKLAFRL